MRQTTFFIVLLSLIGLSSCGFFKDKCFRTYRFEIPFTTYPLKDTLNIGDTLWISADFSGDILDSTKMEYVHTENIDFETKIGLDQIDTNPYKPNVWGSLGPIILEKGEIAPQGISMRIKYRYENNRYLFKLGVVCNKVGVYYLGIHSRYNSSIEVDKNSGCEESKQMTYIMNNGDIEVNHYDLVLASPDTFISRGSGVNGYIFGGSYTFAVK